jgi:hypothetical protein
MQQFNSFDFETLINEYLNSMKVHLTPFQTMRLKSLQQKNIILNRQYKNNSLGVQLKLSGRGLADGPVKVVEKEQPLETIYSTLSNDKVYSARGSPEQSLLSKFKTYSTITTKGSSAKAKRDIFITDFSKEYLTSSYENTIQSKPKLSSSNLPTMPVSNFKGRPVNTSVNKTDNTLLEDLRVSRLKIVVPKRYTSHK